MSKIYEKYMRKCFKLALKAQGKTSPNPLVGCVVLNKEGKIISTGYHKQYGKAHAEADALNKLKNDEAKCGTLIVNLEPCSHYGKTPPCADLIIKHKLKKVVIAIKDPNPIVSGKGIQKLQKAGIEVVCGVLEDEAKKNNEIFLKNVVEQKCFVAIKSATTLDGKIATKNKDSKWITSAKSREEVQNIRNCYDAILTSSSTVLADDPSLTCRIKNGKNPIRIILDRKFKISLNSKVFNDDGTKIILVTEKKVLNLADNIENLVCKTKNSRFELKELLSKLYKMGINSVLIEAGGNLCGDFINNNLVDKIYQFIAPKIIGDKDAINIFEGRSIKKISNALNFKFERITDYSPDILIVYTKLI